MSTKLGDLFQDYEAYHRSRGNKICHYVGIPLIVFTLVGLLREVGWGGLDLALLAGGGVCLYYLSLSLRLAAGMAVFLAFSYVAGPQIPMGLHVAGLFLGWAFQFIGHYVYEKRSPAFYKNLLHLLVGPLWVLARGIPLSRKRSAIPV
jgi:uncharacterized membrane protein YGL010W